MRRVCAWCKVELEPKGSEEGISHGICPGCKFHVYASRGMLLHEYLENIPQPLLMIDGEGKVCGANKAARNMLQKDYPKILNLPGGNVFECKHSYLPEGCGHTTYCSGCSIRNTVMATLNSGTGRTANVELQHKRGDDSVKIDFNITTETDGKVVMMRINPPKSA